MQLETFIIGSRSYQYLHLEEDRKSMRLSVAPNLAITLVCPIAYSREKIAAFLKRKWLWIEKQLQYFKTMIKQESEQDYVSGSNLKYLGKNYMIKVFQSDLDIVKLEKNQINIYTTKEPRDQDNNKILLENWLDHRTLVVFDQRFKAMCKKYQIKIIPELAIRKMSKRWGSCLTSHKIILNPTLILKSKECIDYVITHELCHLEHKNHDKKFFGLLESRIPNWKIIKTKLEIS